MLKFSTTNYMTTTRTYLNSSQIQEEITFVIIKNQQTVKKSKNLISKLFDQNIANQALAVIVPVPETTHIQNCLILSARNARLGSVVKEDTGDNNVTRLESVTRYRASTESKRAFINFLCDRRR